MAAHLGRLETEAITLALCKALGLEDCNPYDYIGRMGAQIRGSGLRVVWLDGKELLAIYPVKTEWAQDEMQCTLQTKYLWVEQATKSPD